MPPVPCWSELCCTQEDNGVDRLPGVVYVIMAWCFASIPSHWLRSRTKLISGLNSLCNVRVIKQLQNTSCCNDHHIQKGISVQKPDNLSGNNKWPKGMAMWNTYSLVSKPLKRQDLLLMAKLHCRLQLKTSKLYASLYSRKKNKVHTVIKEPRLFTKYHKSMLTLAGTFTLYNVLVCRSFCDFVLDWPNHAPLHLRLHFKIHHSLL